MTCRTGSWSLRFVAALRSISAADCGRSSTDSVRCRPTHSICRVGTQTCPMLTGFLLLSPPKITQTVPVLTVFYSNQAINLIHFIMDSNAATNKGRSEQGGQVCTQGHHLYSEQFREVMHGLLRQPGSCHVQTHTQCRILVAFSFETGVMH